MPAYAREFIPGSATARGAAGGRGLGEIGVKVAVAGLK